MVALGHILASSNKALTLSIEVAWWHWAVLAGWFLSLILFDILIVHRRDYTPTIQSALTQSIIWIGLGVGLGLVIWYVYGIEASGQYFSGYLIEKSLSIDNVFAWSVILSYFSIPPKYHHRVLFWGVIGAIIMRSIFVFAGLAAIDHFEPILLVFGALLLVSGYKMFRSKKTDKFHPDKNRLYLRLKSIIPVSSSLDGHKLFTRKQGTLMATMLFMALLAIEASDIVFAVDSVPAIISVSREPFIIIASNAAAIIGMRALYFVFESIKDSFWMLKQALGILLIFVGIKLSLTPDSILGYQWFDYHMPTAVSLVIIVCLLGGAIIGSLLISRPSKGHF